MGLNSAQLRQAIRRAPSYKFLGRVHKVTGMVIESLGPETRIGELCKVTAPGDEQAHLAEVVGFNENRVLLMPLTTTTGIKLGHLVESCGELPSVEVSDAVLGRILNGLGQSIDGVGDLPKGEVYPLNAQPINPMDRRSIATPFSTGIRAIDGLITCGIGQRIGIFAGSGVGKSTLIGNIARNSSADINVISLVGERGREVSGFIERDLGPEGMKKSVVVVSTSDNPPLIRMRAALTATAVAEYFRDQGKNVLLMMDSVTRFAMAQREVGLAAGEPPSTKGYTPSVFALLPQLMERAGQFRKGSITAIYTVLVEGDDMNEPIADAVRSILDGHIVLSRRLAAKNQYPAIDVLSSISRLMPELASLEHQQLASKVRDLMAVYSEAEDLINIGAYVKGSNPNIDQSIAFHEAITTYLRQSTAETGDVDEAVHGLAQIFGLDLQQFLAERGGD
ncbi:MAG: flagellar protein export ATPase FliI [Acidobacteria bacterium]|nr:flagellar protein export ATPase FliI [Acidobacteriota bacterium]